MNRRIVVVFFTMALFILTGIWACEKKPTAPERDNPFDPKSNKQLPPIAKFTFKQDLYNFRLYHFDASESYDYEDGHNLQYRWDFDGDGAFDTAWLTQDTIRHQFGQDGKFTTYLSVRDRNGLSTNVFQEITVKPPVVEMVYVQGGTFTMGDTWGDGDSDERPTQA